MTAPRMRLTPKQRARTALNGILFLLAAGYYQRATQLSFGELSRPGPGVWPTLVAVSAIVICAIGIVESLLKQEEGKTPNIEMPAGVDGRRAAAFSALLVLYIVALPLLGFLWPSFAVVLLSMRVLARDKWWKCALVSGISVGFVYYGFVGLFETRFPPGSLIRMIGG